jgi:hypothetical protein
MVSVIVDFAGNSQQPSLNIFLCLSVKDLAARFADERLSTEKLLAADDESLAEMLIEVRGIGRVSRLYHKLCALLTSRFISPSGLVSIICFFIQEYLIILAQLTCSQSSPSVVQTFFQ